MGKLGNALLVVRNFRYLLPGFRQVARDFRDNELARLAIRHGSDKGLGGHNYTRAYSRVFDPIRTDARWVLEIGLLRKKSRPVDRGGSPVANGLTRAPSMEMWSKYFPNAHLIGLDIGDFSQCDIARFSFIQGDQGSREDLQKVRSLLGDDLLDVVIDDGSHASWDQQISLAVLFPLVRPDGLYIIEDLNGQPEHPKEKSVPKTTEFLKALAGGHQIETPACSPAEVQYLRDHIEATTFYDTARDGNSPVADDALAIIRKRG